jgi:hypothetical protein
LDVPILASSPPSVSLRILVRCLRIAGPLEDGWLPACPRPGIHVAGAPEWVGALLEMVYAPTMEKYYGFIKKLDGSILPNDDLNLVIKTRDEIVHYFPRDTPGEGSKKFIPQDLWPLNKKGLLLNYPPPPDIEIPFRQRITSYRLAYWAWETVDIAVDNFAKAFASTKCPGFLGIYGGRASIFKMYKSIISPEDLAKYDALHGIKSWVV